MADDWKYAVEDFDEPEDEDGARAAGSTEQATDVFGDATPRDELEPGSPSFENALFVAAGVALALMIVLLI